MSSQYPPPTHDDTSQYALYGQAPQAPLLDQQHTPHPQHAPPQMQYSPQGLYPKLENLSELQQQAHQATHALGDQRAHQHPVDPTQHQIALQHTPLPHQQPRPNRLRKACDSCSIRKVKCDESGPPCRACAALEIPCTFDRPSRRRGPPNRHAEAIKKKRRLDAEGVASGTSTPASPTNAAHALAQLSSHAPQLSAESICPVPTMNALIDDFFTYIHPLCPFPHEPSFREAWERREDFTNQPFLALLASMIACLVASFPRKPRLHLKSQTRDQYPSHLALVDKCREVCAQARGPGYLDSPSLNVYDACTSYFLGLTGAYTFQWRQLRLYFGECLTILRALGLHKAQDQGYTFLGGVPATFGANGANFEGSRDLKLDKITEQIGRRLFWTLFAGVRTMQQLGASFGELNILPATPTEPLPPLPDEVDDAFIYPQEVMQQPPHIVPLITGFNLNARIYQSYASLSASEMLFGTDTLFDWERQQAILEQSLNCVKQVLNDIPDVLRVQPKDSQNGTFGRFGQRKAPYYPPMPEYMHVRDPALEAFSGGLDPHETRRTAQYEIQKANVYATHLSIRSYLVEKYFTLLEKANVAKAQNALVGTANMGGNDSALAAGLDRAVQNQGGATTQVASQVDAAKLEGEMAAEREQVVKDLLVVLGSIDMVNMEPNGDSFVSSPSVSAIPLFFHWMSANLTAKSDPENSPNRKHPPRPQRLPLCVQPNRRPQ